jgi:hypothetical protein
MRIDIPYAIQPTAFTLAATLVAATTTFLSPTAQAAAPVVTTSTSPLAAYDEGLMATYLISTDGHVQQLSQIAGWHLNDLTAGANAVAAAAGSPVLTGGFYLSADGHVRQIAGNGSGFGATDLTAVSGAPLAVGNALTGMSVVGYACATCATYRIYFTTATGHIEELAQTAAGRWSATDVTAAIGAVAAAPGSALTSFYVTDDNPYSNYQYPRVYYFSADGHVRELAWGAGWHATDITGTAAGGQPAGNFSTLFGFALYGSNAYKPSFPRIYYFDANHHIQELADAGGWHAGDITSRTGAALAHSQSKLAGFALTWDGLRVYYVAYDGHVHDLNWDGGWTTHDLTAQMSAALPYAGSSLTGYGWKGGSYYGFMYIGTDNHVREFFYSSGHWVVSDANATTTPPSGGGGGGGGGGTHPAN